ncbi:MAG: YeiH family protein [Clostridiales bacterium]|uniref:YeiH family protein n=1 Tax=Hornefia butyriciproducens TaxID=2652293 RepID=UPI0029F79E94|nr:YeiH family protein [Hornefia butyriciproducens]MCI7414077.1 YeiH family protein [Clostridiales bacterium]MCI7679905.1 YeiH family protein [Clostridiales bacterium]MDD7020545.1 YeiH family protein [Hornefia butyriciproducens]MDY5463049.1 YeiH family protein [Hornefia butyriciproducens]MDY6212763.1 YeiH family protein [Hornefia butyriciproducens]
MEFMKTNGRGILLCIGIAAPAWLLGRAFPVVGGPIFGILIGMALCLALRDKEVYRAGIAFTSKKILQAAVVLLGFGLNLGVIAQTGKQSLPIIICTITTSLVIAWLFHKATGTPGQISMLIGVGSSICGGSAVAATASVIDAKDEDIAQAISVIFFFNVLAAVLFPPLGHLLGFDTASGEAFGVFAGTAVNDTSSVTATAATWDSMWNLGTATLDKAVTVKLTRTLAIIPITMAIAFMQTRKEDVRERAEGKNVSVLSVFPMFILYFILASVITTAATGAGVPADIFTPLKELSKIFIIMAMAAIGLNTNIVELVKKGGKPILMGLCCWIGITVVSLVLQRMMGIW